MSLYRDAKLSRIGLGISIVVAGVAMIPPAWAEDVLATKEIQPEIGQLTQAL